MKLGKRQIAELVAVVGVVCGVFALFLVWGFGLLKYSNDGTFLAAELVLLGLAAGCLAGSLLIGKAELDLIAAVAGAGAFGLYLFEPARHAFNALGFLNAGAWLGVCTGLIPIGAGAAQLWHGRSKNKTPGVNLWTAGAAAGLVLIVVGLWSSIEKDPRFITYWNASFSGHALGLLLLIIAIVSAVLIAAAAISRKAELADLALIVSTVLAGLAANEGVSDALGSSGSMATGAWLELVGGVVLVLALIGHRVVKLPELKLPESKMKR